MPLVKHTQTCNCISREWPCKGKPNYSHYCDVCLRNLVLTSAASSLPSVEPGQQTEGDLPYGAAFLRKAPADTSQPGCQVISDDTMSYLFLFRAVLEDLGLETGFFLRWQRRKGAFLPASWKPKRQLLHRVLPWQKEWVRTSISVVCCWVSHYRLLYQVRTALNI